MPKFTALIFMFNFFILFLFFFFYKLRLLCIPQLTGQQAHQHVFTTEKRRKKAEKEKARETFLICDLCLCH